MFEVRLKLLSRMASFDPLAVIYHMRAEDPPPSSPSASLTSDSTSTATAVSVCHYCEARRPPFLALAEQGALYEACGLCFALRTTLALARDLPTEGAGIALLTEFAEQLLHTATQIRNRHVVEVVDP